MGNLYIVYTVRYIHSGYKMKDIFDTKIVCNECDIEMNKVVVEKEGVNLRAVKCEGCGDTIVHPSDKKYLQHYNDNLKGKVYSVKLRIIGNSHAISIPKEIVDFINSQHNQMEREMNDMVKLSFDNFKKLSLRF